MKNGNVEVGKYKSGVGVYNIALHPDFLLGGEGCHYMNLNVRIAGMRWKSI